jgi:hypothetical protein
VLGTGGLFRYMYLVSIPPKKIAQVLVLESGDSSSSLIAEYRHCDKERSSKASMGGGGGGERAAPSLHVYKPEKRGSRSEAKTHSSIIYLSRILCLCVCVCVTICVGTLCYSFSFSNQTDQGNETEGLEREG